MHKYKSNEINQRGKDKDDSRSLSLSLSLSWKSKENKVWGQEEHWQVSPVKWNNIKLIVGKVGLKSQK